MPGTSSVARLAVSAPAVGIGHVPPALPTSHTTCISVAPMLTQPTTIPVTAAPPYAASLLPK